MGKNLKLISAAYIGGYNDTTVYDAILNYFDEKIHIDIEEHSHDMQIPDKTWQVITDINITSKEKEEILKAIIKNKPIHFADASPIIYNKEINVIDEIKTLKGWNESKFKILTDYLKIGDRVDKKLIDSLISELPPKTLNGEIVQLAEAYSNNKYGKDTYITFATEVPFGDWYYKGACLLGQTNNQERDFEEFDMSYMEEDLEEETL